MQISSEKTSRSRHHLKPRVQKGSTGFCENAHDFCFSKSARYPPPPPGRHYVMGIYDRQTGV